MTCCEITLAYIVTSPSLYCISAIIITYGASGIRMLKLVHEPRSSIEIHIKRYFLLKPNYLNRRKCREARETLNSVSLLQLFEGYGHHSNGFEICKNCQRSFSTSIYRFKSSIRVFSIRVFDQYCEYLG